MLKPQSVLLGFSVEAAEFPLLKRAAGEVGQMQNHLTRVAAAVGRQGVGSRVPGAAPSAFSHCGRACLASPLHRRVARRVLPAQLLSLSLCLSLVCGAACTSGSCSPARGGRGVLCPFACRCALVLGADGGSAAASARVPVSTHTRAFASGGVLGLT